MFGNKKAWMLSMNSTSTQRNHNYVSCQATTTRACDNYFTTRTGLLL